jgi:hypothetical protein
MFAWLLVPLLAEDSGCKTVVSNHCLIEDIVKAWDPCTPQCQKYYTSLSYQCYIDNRDHFAWKAMQQSCDPQQIKQFTPPAEPVELDTSAVEKTDADSSACFFALLAVLLQ